MIHPKTRLSIDGKNIPYFDAISLTQSMNDHHSFRIQLDNDVIEKTGSHTIDASRNWLGKVVIITFDETDFLGIITEINLANDNGHHGNLILEGYSPTILLEGGEDMRSWKEKRLEQIVKEILGVLTIKKKIAPRFKDKMPYQVQYKEHHFQFLQRLAKQYNEWFYYDGLSIVFGAPKWRDAVTVEYGREIDELYLQMRVKDHTQQMYSYNAMDNRVVNAKSKNAVAGLNELGMHAFQASSKLYVNRKNSFSDIDAKDKYLIDGVAERKQAQAAARLHVLRGKGHKQGLTIGSVIKVDSAKNEGKKLFKIQSYGKYVITSITHTVSKENSYSNSFEAIPSEIKIPEEPKVALPKAAPQLATVVANKDEKSKGRIKVKMQWQLGDMETPWLRVMTPDAGQTDDHKEIRGNVVIPELGDQVMIGFEYNDPNRPFVMGSMYHGMNITKGMENRNSLISRTGSRMIMDDNDGSLQLTDKGGVDMKFDGKGNATAKVNKNNTVNTGTINTFNTGAEQIINVGATKDSPPKSVLRMDKEGNIILESDTSIVFKVGESIIKITESEIKTMIANGNMTTEATNGEHKIIAKGLDITSKTKCRVTSKSTMEIKGSEVEINKG